MFLDLQDLSMFNIDLEDIKDSKDYYQTLCHFRDKKIGDNQKETTKKRDDLKKTHEISNQVCTLMKQIVLNDIKMNALNL